MPDLTDVLKEINLGQVVAIGSMIWLFYTRIDAKIDKLEKKFEKLEDKFEKLEDKVDNVDKRLCRIEGSLATQGHCLVSNQCDKKIAEEQ